MDKNIKYLIEAIQNFNPVEYQDEQNNIINQDDIANIINYKPKNKAELRQIIKKRIDLQMNNDIIQPYLQDIDVSLITDFSSLFTILCKDLNKPIILDLSTWNTVNATTMAKMFRRCETLIKLDISNFNTDNVENMYCMFDECKMLTELDLSSFNTKKCIDTSFMFSACKSLTELDLSNFETENLESMTGMFEYCISLKKINMSNFAPKNIKYDFARVFKNCKSLISLDIHNININVPNTMETFYNCCNLQSLRLGNFNYETIDDSNGMFFNVPEKLIPNWYKQ